MRRMFKRVLVLLVMSCLVGCRPEPEESHTYSTHAYTNPVWNCYRLRQKTGFELKLGFGFDPESFEEKIVTLAAERWADATDLPITVTSGHGMKGYVHVYEEMQVCAGGTPRIKWPFEDLGCYVADVDRIELSRAAIKDLAKLVIEDAGGAAPSEKKLCEQILFAVSLHEIGHWLGIGKLGGLPGEHEPPGTESIMVPGMYDLFVGEQGWNRISSGDVHPAKFANFDRCR